MTTGADYFKSDGKFIYLTSEMCEFYIPMDFFSNTKYAEDNGDYIKTIGLFGVSFFSNGKVIEKRTMNLPTWIQVYVYDSEVRNVILPGEDKEIQCRVLIYNKGNKVMNANVIKDSANAETYLQLICSGKIPHSVPYNKSAQIWKKNQAMNGVKLGVPAVTEELILSVAYRNKNNPGEKFCKVIGKDNTKATMFDYKMANIRQICQYTSTFTALWFEDFDSMVTTSLNRAKEKKPETESPLEEIIKM